MAKKITVLFKGLLTALLIFPAQGLLGQEFTLDTMEINEVIITGSRKKCIETFQDTFKNIKLYTKRQPVRLRAQKTFRNTPDKNIKITGIAEVRKTFLSKRLRLKNIELKSKPDSTTNGKLSDYRESFQRLMKLNHAVWKILKGNSELKKYFSCQNFHGSYWVFTTNEKLRNKLNEMQDTLFVENNGSMTLYAEFSSKRELKTLELKAPADFYRNGHKDRSVKYSFKTTRKGVEIKQAQAKANDQKDHYSITRLTIDF